MADTEFTEDGDRLLAFTVEIVTAHIAHNSVPVSDVPHFISTVHATLSGLSGTADEPEESPYATPIMDPKKAVRPDSITCLICGKKAKMLRQHIASQHSLSPNAYRMKFGLPDDYPMTAKKTRDSFRDRALNLRLPERMAAARAAKGQTQATGGK